jgi:predicted MFS family arabinose efflux permease
VLYPVYALLFADTGLSPGRISALFAIWSLTAFLCEVPSGALADLVSRRRMLAFAQVLRAAGFLLWVALPSFPAFAAGFVLWGMASALTSGTEQALVYDELAALGHAEEYPRLMGRAETAQLLGNAAATALAAPVVALGGYPLAGAFSVAVSLLAAAVALSLPEAPRVEEVAEGAYLATLRAGLGEAARHRVVRLALLLAALLPGLWAVDEYLPLLAGDKGAATEAVPLLLLPMLACQAAGNILAGRLARLRPTRVAAMIGTGAALLAAGALLGPAWLALLVIAPGMALFSLSNVLIDARLQDTMRGTARATVTSVAGFGAELTAFAVFGGYALATALGLSVAGTVALVAVPMGLLALVAPRWLPAAPREHEEARMAP